MIVLVPQTTNAQHGPEAEIAGLPDWLVLEKGRVEYDKKEYGRALYFFRAAIALRDDKPYPEAEEALGDVYLADNEPRLAERHYNRALQMSQAMEFPETRYRVIYKLADLYLEQERYKDFSDRLLQIVAENVHYSDPKQEIIRQAMRRLYRDQGFDAVVRYYRTENMFAARAHADLGWFYYRTGLSKEQSILHLLFATDTVLTAAVEELRRLDPEYAYTDLSTFIGLALGRDNTRELLLENGFFRSLYYLACASYSSGEMTRRARELWGVLSRTPDAGEYARLASQQLAAPWSEPLINPSSRNIDNIEIR